MSSLLREQRCRQIFLWDHAGSYDTVTIGPGTLQESKESGEMIPITLERYLDGNPGDGEILREIRGHEFRRSLSRIARDFREPKNAGVVAYPRVEPSSAFTLDRGQTLP
jgi:hypothetical protein